MGIYTIRCTIVGAFHECTMPSKVKHLGATDCDNEAKYHKNRGEDAEAKKKTSKTDKLFGNGKSSKMKKCGSTGNIVVMSAMSP
eukprot:scaffold21628_cov31-Attheya_sp.AAC.2